jgi:hypothetical protein
VLRRRLSCRIYPLLVLVVVHESHVEIQVSCTSLSRCRCTFTQLQQIGQFPISHKAEIPVIEISKNLPMFIGQVSPIRVL